MTIKFHCEHCGKLIQAPDNAGGRRGKCPHCPGSNYIPTPDATEIDLAPLDEGDELERRQEIDSLMAAERDLLSHTTRAESAPRLNEKHADQISSKDLHHLVVNYCLDMAAGQLERADRAAFELNGHHDANRQAISDFVTGQVLEPALDAIPTKVLQGFLANLMKQMQ